MGRQRWIGLRPAGWQRSLVLFRLVLSVAIALLRGNHWAAVALAILGLLLLGIALGLLRSGYLLRARLLANLEKLKQVTTIVLCMIVGSVILTGSPALCFAVQELRTQNASLESKSGDVIPAEIGGLSVSVRQLDIRDDLEQTSDRSER